MAPIRNWLWHHQNRRFLLRQIWPTWQARRWNCNLCPIWNTIPLEGSKRPVWPRSRRTSTRIRLCKGCCSLHLYTTFFAISITKSHQREDSQRCWRPPDERSNLQTSYPGRLQPLQNRPLVLWPKSYRHSPPANQGTPHSRPHSDKQRTFWHIHGLLCHI